MTMKKEAELSNTHAMPAGMADKTPEQTKAVVKKAGHLLNGHHDHPACTGDDSATPGVTPQRLPQQKIMRPHVDVSAFEPPKKIQQKEAAAYALNGRYPLDSYEQVKTASAYFDEFGKRFAPEDRREYCMNLVKRAEALGIAISDDAKKYGSSTYAPDEEVKLALDARRTLLDDKKLQTALDKLAFIRPQMDPELFCLTLGEFDKTAGLEFFYDRDVPDPYYSTYGFQKEATFSEVIGNTRVTAADLEYLAMKRLPLVKGTFNEEMAKEFQKDPVGIYKSLPLAQRKVLANMACDQHAGTPGSG